MSVDIGDIITRVYTSFRGVDFRGDETAQTRSPDALNMWRDYKDLDCIKTRLAMASVGSFTEAVYGIFFYDVGSKHYTLIHSGTKLYQIDAGTRSVLYEGLNPARSKSFIYNNIFYFKDGLNYLSYDGTTITTVAGYVPTTTIGRKPAGGGTTYEDINMLTGIRINTFLADGESTDFYLDAQNIDTDFTCIVKVNDVATTDFTVETSSGMIKFKMAPPEPLTDGQDNVSVKFRKTVAGYRDRIDHCTLLQVFDNRVFFSGNPDYPNVVWHCSLDDPTYCSDLDYYNEGLDLSPIRGLVAGNNALYVFKEPSQANTAVFYHTPTIDSDYGKVYPSSHSSIATGCIGGAVNFNDDICFFSPRGLEGISGSIGTEQVVAHRSTLIDRKLLAESGYTDMILEEWEGYLLVIIGSHVYLADSRSTFTNESHIEYDWYYWELEAPVTCTAVKDNILYLGTADGYYTLTDAEGAVSSYWTTSLDRFGYPHHQKTTNKRGCVIEALGDVAVSVRTNKDAWRTVATEEDVTDYFTARIKMKKFKDIQLKFSTDTRFSLECATLEAYLGGYIKH